MPDLSKEDIEFIKALRSSTEQVGSNGSFPATVIPQIRPTDQGGVIHTAIQKLSDRVERLER